MADRKKERELPLAQRSITTSQTEYTPTIRKNDFTPEEFDPNNVKLPRYFDDIYRQAREKEDEYKQRYDQAGRNTKIQAWGNLLSAMGQLAGMGRQTTRPSQENHNLSRAFADVDRFRSFYEGIKDANAARMTTLQANYIQNQEKRFDKQQELANKAKQSYVDNLNKLELAKFNNNAVKTTDVHNKNSEYKERQLSQGDERNRIARENAEIRRNSGTGGKKEPFVTYVDYTNRTKYPLSISQAIEVLNKVKSDPKRYKVNEDNLSMIEAAITGKLSLNNTDLKSLTLDYLNKYRGDFYDIIKNADLPAYSSSNINPSPVKKWF